MKQKAIICDIDGTIARRGNRDPYDMTKVSEDTVNVPVAIMVKALHGMGYTVVFTSGRDDTARNATLQWLDDYVGVDGYDLMMRAKNDTRNDAVVKREMYDIITTLYDVFVVFDDRDRVVKMWRELGLTCFQVAESPD